MKSFKEFTGTSAVVGTGDDCRDSTSIYEIKRRRKGTKS